MIDHPRFGKIRSIVLLKDVKAGEELFCDYGYLISPNIRYYLDKYFKSETAIKTIYNLSKWFMNENDEEALVSWKKQFKYIRKKIKDFQPYLGMFKAFSSLIHTEL